MTQPDSKTTDSSSTPADSPKPSTPADSPKPSTPADLPTPPAPSATDTKLDKLLQLLERSLTPPAAGEQSPPLGAPVPVQQEQQQGAPGAVVVTPPTVTPEVTIPTPAVRAPEPQTIIVAPPVTPSVIAPPRQLKTGDRVIHRYHDDYGSDPGGSDVVDHGIVVEQSAKQIDDGGGQGHLEYVCRVAWLRDVSDPLAEDSLELQP